MKISVPSLIIGGTTGITLAYNGFGVWSLVWSGIVQSATAAIQLWFWSDWRPSLNFSKEKFKEHFHFGYKLTLSSLLDTLFNNVYTILIGKFFAPAMVGFYNRADTLKQLPVTNIGSILNKVTFPLFSKVQHDDVVLKNLYKKLMQLVIYIVAPIILFMSALAEPLFRFLFTEKWLPAVPYFQILCWNGILYPIHSYNLNILKVKGRSDLFLKLEIIKKITISLMIIVSFQFGIYGLLYSSVIFSFVGFFINTYYSGRFINYKSWEQIKDIFPTILLATVCAVLIYFFDRHFQTFFHYDFLRLVIASFFGLIVYISISLAFKIQSLFELINIIKRK
jgi:O-antigen/teichoic acid export membrane protein